MDQLIVPVKRWRMLANTGYWCIVTTILAGACAYSAAERGLDSAVGRITAGFALLWTISAGSLGWSAGRRLCSAGLLLDQDGFRFVGKRWRWAEIDALRMVEHRDDESRSMRIYVRLRTDDPVHPRWVETPIDTQDFEMDGESLESILRRWLKRYGPASAVDANPESTPD